MAYLEIDVDAPQLNCLLEPLDSCVVIGNTTGIEQSLLAREEQELERSRWAAGCSKRCFRTEEIELRRRNQLPRFIEKPRSAGSLRKNLGLRDGDGKGFGGR